VDECQPLIPGDATISGDIRLTPFYDVSAVKACIEAGAYTRSHFRST